MKVSISKKMLSVFVLVTVIIFAVIASNDLARIRLQLENSYLANAIVAARSLDAAMISVADVENHNESFVTIQKAIWLNPDILKISVNLPVNDVLTAVVSSDPTNLGQPAGADSARSFDDDVVVHSFRSVGEERALLLTTPIHISGIQRGTIEIEFTLEQVERATIDTFVFDLFFFAFTIITLSLFLFVSVRFIIIGRLKRLRDIVEEFGHAGVMPSLDLSSGDEIGDLSRGFKQMTIDLSEAQEKVKRSQRLEAIGQLTGGIAHDFNNLLAVIHGNAELIAHGTREDIDDLARSVLRSAKRGAELTQHLLAFSRQQPLKPQSIDLKVLLADLPDLLGRVLGETISIETDFQADLWWVMADPGQVENAVLNLAINARDAMSEEGELTIRCANTHLGENHFGPDSGAEAGDYVVLSVSDTGMGMTAQVRERAFEPFFSTKEVGQGSGLGLSMVYGFAKQSGGHVIIESAEGQGTTVRLYLPRSNPVIVPKGKEAAGQTPNGRGEVVLVIEDCKDVGAVVRAMLKRLNYRVIEVSEVASAKRKLEAEHVDLILSDVVLPGGMSGSDFARELRAQQPDLKVVLMSGYPTEKAEDGDEIGTENLLLHKPFDRRQLAEALRQALG